MTAPRRHLSRGAGVALGALLLVAVVALALPAALAPVPKRTPPVASATPVAFPSAEPSFDLQLPLTSTEVAAGHKITLKGAGARQVAYRITDAAPIVARLDFWGGPAIAKLVWSDEAQPLYSGGAPWAGDFLLNTDPGRREGLLVVDSTSSWQLTLTSTTDLPRRTGTVQGAGPAVVSLAGPGSGVVAALPRSGAFRVRVYSADGTLAGERAGAAASDGSVTIPAALPAIVAIEADGAWSLTAS